MAAQIYQYQHLRLVNKTKEREAVEEVVDRFRRIYDSWDRDDVRSLFAMTLKQSDALRKETWMMCVSRHESEVILAAMDLVLSGETEFNVTPPTPMQFSELCHRVKNGENKPAGPWRDIFE